MTTYTIGADPELFMSLDGVIQSVFGILPGNKKNPHPVNKGAVQVDGMAAEFNIDPAATEVDFVTNLTTVMKTMEDMLPGTLVAQPTAHFTPEYLAERDEREVEMGCDPDLNAWSLATNEAPNVEAPFRTGGGHVHVGFCENANVEDPAHVAVAAAVAKQMDFFLGLPSVIYDKDVERRGLYGKAGAFRAKPYGMEYRVLSNAWLSSEEHMAWVFRAAQAAMKALDDGNILANKYGDIQDIINNSDVDAAMAIIEAENLEVPNV